MSEAGTQNSENGLGRLFFIGIPGPEIDAETESLLAEVRPGGICLFARNIRSAEQTRQLTDDLRKILGDSLLISIDQEGGLVDRLKRVFGPMPAAANIKTAEQAHLLGRITARALLQLGINMNFAPVVDVIDDARLSVNNGLYSRNFGKDAESAAAFAEEYLRGLSGQGVVGCLKHFPGLGASRVDSHLELPVVDIDRGTLETVDLLPYRRLIASGHNVMIMTAHCAYPNAGLQYDDTAGGMVPASLNRRVLIDLLRGELGFGGVAITDDLEMGAIAQNFGIADACRRAVIAGEDMLAICASPDAIRTGFEAVREAVRSGAISAERLNEAFERIGRLSASVSPPAEFSHSEIKSLSDEIRELNSQL